MTTGDWDFSGTNWALDVAVYVSSPSSVRRNGSGNLIYTAKNTIAPPTYLKEGRLVTYFRLEQWAYGGVDSQIMFLFRYQSEWNTYFVSAKRTVTDAMDWVIGRYIDGFLTTLKSATLTTLPFGAFNKLRITFWKDAAGLVIRVEYWNGSAWVSLVSDTYDSADQWGDVGGKIGFKDIGVSGGPATSAYIDDTEIWGFIP